MSKSEVFDQICNEILSYIEIREARSLNWGFFRAISQSLDWLDGEIPTILEHLSPRIKRIANNLDQITADQVIANLVERKLIFDNGQGIYRSRFAETVRLLYLLRQRFSDDDWNDGARLISDIKILLRRRRFPDWNIAISGILDSSLNLTNIQKNAILTLVGKDLLAKFQADAIDQILSSLQKNIDSAIVIGAGTGAGKTKAFYIPALAHIAMEKSNDSVVQAIALYPRVELLKDQFRETFQETRKLDALLAKQGKAPIRIGAYYGSVPRNAKDFSRRNMSELDWRRTREDDGWICPYMVCPYCGKESLAWSDENINLEVKNSQTIGQYEILECLSCKSTTSGDIFPLTREHMLQAPPDILFTTTEMLNRRLSAPEEHHLFGIDIPKPPRLLLMDEIHLNEGFHGAQVAYLLRRWRYARGNVSGLCVVGLSATLTQAELFFSRLTGIENVCYITPADEDLIDESLEYNIVAKGDIASGTTLLSSSVRTVMLLGRTLDPLDTNPTISRGAWGQRIFAFSDKLDSINRWYHILKEVENPTQPYAQWRLIDPKKNREAWSTRNDAGQNWWIATQISNQALKNGLFIDITSSQYRGVNPRANVVIASSTLEVGYNDPKVGAIIQHKAPHSHASFLQRKGRAGRSRNMRPWMILIASSYGRDRWAFQHAEALFEPLIPPINLPIENYYVRKVQAVFALMDWVADQLKKRGCSKISLWNLLGSETQFQQADFHKGPRNTLIQILNEVVYNSSVRNSLFLHIKNALDISDEHILNMLFWGVPRSIMLDVIPSILRQLQTDWQRIIYDQKWEVIKWADNISSSPLPEFVPQSLFSDLNIPEVIIRVPEKARFKEEDRRIRSQEALSLTLGMMEFTPGKVNKRYAFKDRVSESHWIPIPDASTNQIDINELDITFSNSPYTISINEHDILVYRPYIFDLQTVPNYIRPTSNAFHNWKSHFISRSSRYFLSDDHQIPMLEGDHIELDATSQWNATIPKIFSFMHTEGKWAEVTRYTASTDIYTRYENGFEDRKTISYLANDLPAAMGFRNDVDALYFSVFPLDFESLTQNNKWSSIYQQLKGRFFRHKLSIVFPELSQFDIDWIWQVEFSMLVERATTLNLSLQDANKYLHDIASREELIQQSLHLIFDCSTLDTDGNSEIEEKSYLKERLHSLLINPDIVSRLKIATSCLWDTHDHDLQEWIKNVYMHTVGAAMFSAITTMVPDVDPDDLHLDVEKDGFWISELTGGGVGLIARIVAKIHSSPHQLDAFLQHVVDHCEREHVASQLNQLANKITEPRIAESFQKIRSTSELHHIEKLHLNLSETLNDFGIVPSRNLLVAINTKFLRPNSGSDTDELIQLLVDFWQNQQNRLGCEIDIQIIAAAAAQNQAIQEKVKAIFSRIQEDQKADDPAQIYNLLQSILWLNCHDSCPDCIERYHIFQKSEKASRYLLQAIIHLNSDAIEFSKSNWEKEAIKKLVEHYRVIIKCPEEKGSLLHMHLIQWMSEP
ncbi:MAG: DEAD/DEAH box helicase, partial [Candidatus Brocadiales bacterium]|nr:DEAD/DEAH box helicase [Candidatus Brocadiales bacterium]